MAEILELVCDQCGAVERTPAFGWFAIKPAKKSEVVSDPPAKGDFCSRDCLTTYVGRMAMQMGMVELVAEASAALDGGEAPSG